MKGRGLGSITPAWIPIHLSYAMVHLLTIQFSRPAATQKATTIAPRMRENRQSRITSHQGIMWSPPTRC